MSTDGRVVLITGVTGPLGRVAAARFGRDGFRIAGVGRDRERLDALAREAGLDAEAWLPVVGELTDAEAARAVAQAVIERFGRIDVLLHLVGGWAGGTPVVELDPAEVADMLDRHVWTTLHVVQAVVPGMAERGFGRVLAASSPYAVTPGPKGASYALAKAAEEILLRSLAREVAAAGVTVNVVSIRTIDAKHEREAAPSPKNASWTTPEEILETFAFLASDAGGAVNGARIALDGR
jgi:NAD(P)-dependent dehydrogenase (short-subunit alcohol dehydrogenase family)